GTGSFNVSSRLGGAQGTLTSWSGGNHSPVLSDENGDGNLDVVAWSFRRGKIWTIPATEPNGRIALCNYKWWRNVWLGRGNGTFAPLLVTHQGEVKGGYVPEERFSDPSVGEDINLDGLVDYAGFSRDRRGQCVGPIRVDLAIGSNIPPDRRWVEVPDMTF